MARVKLQSNIYTMKNGQRVHVSNREAKKFIMQQHGWTSEEYKKHYDIFKNKLRAYEDYIFKDKKGGVIVPASAVELLYKQAKAMKREGKNYKESIKMKTINSFTSISSGKAGQKALQNKRYLERRGKTFAEGTNAQFKGFMEKNAKAREIADAIKDPVKREQALKEYAYKLKASINEHDEVVENSAIPFGETYGSETSIDFDYSDYLDGNY